MEKKLIELSLQRGRLQERIAAQRGTLALQLRPVAGTLDAADRGLAMLRSGIACLKRHPLETGAAVALLAALRPRRAWRLGRRALLAWHLWRRARAQLAAAGFDFSRPAA